MKLRGASQSLVTGALVILMVTVMCDEVWMVGPSSASSFCSRIKSSCPSPPTVDTVKIDHYLGVWYEIGSTARFKFQNEAGLVCGQGNYTLLSPPNQNGLSAKLNILNSGLPVIGSRGAQSVSSLSKSSRLFCLSSKQICNLLDPIADALHNVSVVIHDIAFSSPVLAFNLSHICTNISTSVNALEDALGSLAFKLTEIQLLNGRLSQAVGKASDNVDALDRIIRLVREEQATAKEIVMRIRNASVEIQDVSKSVEVVAASLAQAGSLIEESADKITLRLGRMSVELNAMHEASMSMLADEEWRNRREATSVLGKVTQSNRSAGKLETTVGGYSGDYWIIALEGDEEEGYSASLVYSCRQGQEEEELLEDLFIISRARQLPMDAIARLLRLAEEKGISTDCENPFVYTVQGQGECGSVPPRT